MPSDRIPCVEGPGTTGDVRVWSEDPLTARARSVWTSGDFLPIARSFESGAEAFVARLALRPGETVLDVACATGNLALPAARTGARVTPTAPPWWRGNTSTCRRASPDPATHFTPSRRKQ